MQPEGNVKAEKIRKRILDMTMTHKFPRLLIPSDRSVRYLGGEGLFIEKSRESHDESSQRRRHKKPVQSHLGRAHRSAIALRPNATVYRAAPDPRSHQSAGVP